jgi:hypothetical protein
MGCKLSKVCILTKIDRNLSSEVYCDVWDCVDKLLDDAEFRNQVEQKLEATTKEIEGIISEKIMEKLKIPKEKNTFKIKLLRYSRKESS